MAQIAHSTYANTNKDNLNGIRASCSHLLHNTGAVADLLGRCPEMHMHFVQHPVFLVSWPGDVCAIAEGAGVFPEKICHLAVQGDGEQGWTSNGRDCPGPRA